MKKFNLKKLNLEAMDVEEEKILKSIKKDIWKPSRNLKKEIEFLKRTAENTTEKIKKDKSITIRISSFDLECLKSKSVVEGIPYQTLISSVLHKYNSGVLVQKNENKL